MTSKQALAAALKIDPARSYCAQKQEWKYNHDSNAAAPIFSLFVLPGLDGSNCQQFDSKSDLRDCITQYKAALETNNPA
jgi:hypothetical protein